MAALVAMLMAFGVLVAGPVPAAFAAAAVTVSSDDATILAGENREYTFTVSNTGDENGYNLAFAIEVPVGIAFVSSPVGAPRVYDAVEDVPGEPVANPGMVLWVWEDVADLPVGADYALTVVVDPAQPALADPRYTDDTTVFPVAASWDAVAHAYFSTDPTYLPVFNGSTGVGGVDAETATVASAAASTRTETTAIRIEKSEPSPESELVRGVHDEVTVYTLRVTNNDTHATENVVVTDYLPAGLEFLECGDIDNSSAVAEEYDGSGPLGGATLADCAIPVSVETILVTDAASGSHLPERLAPGVYTKVVWELGTLAAGEVRETRYAAAVPLYENTMDFGGETPDPESRGQAANLDNNNGPSTRHGAQGTPTDGDAWTNSARVDGTFLGMVFAPDAGSADSLRSVSHEADHTITAMDLAVVKSTASGSFTQDARRPFTLTLRTGEYATADSIVLTDVVGNGLCPLVPAGTPLSGSGFPEECAPAQNAGVIGGGAVVESVIFDAATGEFTLVLDLAGVTVGASDTHAVTYEVLQRASYIEAAQYGPTTSGDSFSNAVSLTAQTTLVDEVAALPGELGAFDVWDDSAVTIESDVATITKEVLERNAVDAGSTGVCDVTTGWVDGVGDVPTGFRPGDTVCYRLTVDFADGVATRNAAIADFLPAGLEFVSATTVGSPTWAPSSPTTTGQRLEWLLGEVGAGGDRYVPAGATLQILVQARIPVGVTAVTADKPDNLMKYRQENVSGEVFFLRDAASFERDPGLSLVKGVRDVNGDTLRRATTQDDADGMTFASNRDGIEVRQGDLVTYRIDIEGGHDTYDGVTVWDALPAGITAADVAVVGNGGTVTDSALDGRTLIEWTGLTVPITGLTLTYVVEVPAGVSVNTYLDNTASVVAIRGTSNAGDTVELYPAGSLDTGVAANFPGDGLRDDSNVFLPGVEVVKDVIDSRVEASNTLTQAVIGELITYEYSVTIPGGTTVYNGALSDVLPATLQLYSGFTPEWDFAINGAPAAQPAGFALDALGTLRFPTQWDIPADETHTFTVTVQAFPTLTGNGSHGATRDNQATFGSTASINPGSTRYTDTDQARVTIVTPNPSLEKRITHVDGVANSANPASASAESVVTFELRTRNANNRPTSFDTVVTDCVPGEFTDVVIVSASQGTAVAETAAGCDGTLITWNVGEVHGTAYRTLTFTASVNSEPSGLEVYRNTANLMGYGLPSGSESGVRAEYTRSSSASVEVPGATQTKTVTPSTGTIGDSVTYTLTTTLPPHVNFYDAYVRDGVPEGLAITATRIVSSDVPLNNASPATTGGSAASLTWTANTPGGDILASDTERTIVIEVDATIVDIPTNTSGTTRVNTAALYWNTDNGNSNSGVKSPDATATVTVHEPQLSIAKTGPAGQVEPGDTFTYGITVTNANTPTTSTAYDITVVDIVPAGVIVDRASIIASGGTPSPATGRVATITWTIDSLAPGASAVFGYSATLAPSGEISEETAASVFTNNAAVTEYFSLPDDDPGADDRRQYDPVDDDAVVDPIFPLVTVTKTAGAGSSPAYHGESVEFTIEIENTSAATAYDLVIKDVLPANWSYVDGTARIDGSIIGADPVLGAGGTLTWSLTELYQDFVFITYEAVPSDAADTGSGFDHTNTVTVTYEDGSGADGNADRDYEASADASVQIHEADLVLVKSHTGTALAGTEFEWTITVSNHADATDSAVGPFIVTETLPDGVSYDGDFTGLGWTQTGRTGNVVTFQHNGPGGLTPGASLPVLTLTVTLDDDLTEGTTLTNEAEVDGRTHDVDPSNNDDEDTVTVTTEADLVLEKSITDTSFVAGEDAVWNITVRNDGPSVSHGPITVTDTLPEGVDLVGTTASGPDVVCGSVDTATRELECVHAGDLAVGDTFTITVTTPVLSSTTDALYNHAIVDPTTPDTNLDNNEDTASVDPVGTRVDLEIEKSLVSEGLTVGETGRYRIDVTNHGPSDALNVTVTDILPAGLTYAGGITGDWTCAPDAGNALVVECELAINAGTLAAGASTWFEFDVTLASDLTGDVTNAALVSTTTDETNYANNADVVTTTVTTATELELDKSTTATVLTGGDTVQYELTVTNDSPSDATNVVLTDTLPAELRYVSATAAAPTGSIPAWDTCTITGQDADGYGGTVECELSGALIAGATAPLVTIEAVVHPTAGSSGLVDDIINDAAVTWTDLAHENPGRDDDTASTPLLWVNVTSFEQCFADTPYIDFRLIASAGIDLSAQPITLDWYKDNNRNGIPEDPTGLATDDPAAADDPNAAPVATFTIDGTAGILTTDDGTEYPVTVTSGPDGIEISGRADWPGTVLDADGIGVAWPGYRLALPGETPDFENLVYDETVFGANLRPGAMLAISATATAILSLEYPAVNEDCVMLRTPALELTKQATVTEVRGSDRFSYFVDSTNVDYGAAFPVTLTDPIPADLKVLAVTPDVPTDATAPAWDTCAITGQDAHGYGGTVVCELDRHLGYGQSAPRVTIDVEVHPSNVGETITNTATLTWMDPDGDSPDGSVSDTAIVNAGWLARTGAEGVTLTLLVMTALFGIGGALVLAARHRERRSAD